MLSCFYARRPLDAAQLGCQWGRGVMPPVSADACSDLARRFTNVRARANDLLGEDTSPDDRVTLELIAEMCGYEIADLRAESSRYVVSPLPEAGLSSQILVWLPSATIGSSADEELYLASCRAIPQALEDSAEELAAGRLHGQFPVRHLLERACEQIDKYLKTPLATDPILSALPRGAAASVLAELTTIVSERLRPAFARYVAMLRDDAWPSARGDDRAGIGWLPGGDEIYEQAIVTNTTLKLSSERVHEIGLGLVAKLRHDAEQIAVALGWPPSFAKVRDRMRSDPELRYADGNSMLRDAELAMRRASAAVPLWITDQPMSECALVPMGTLESPNGVLGRYETAPMSRSTPARYWLNILRPSSRATYETEVLSFHESIPGHHTQISASQQLATVSRFRSLVHVLAYSEGWALYMEHFADEIGLYSSEISRLGMASFALWRACRLVVDTGLHRFRWTREQAIDYLRENTILTMKNIENEVDRYIAFPASALGYMIGRLAMSSLRSGMIKDPSSPAENRQFFTRLLGSGPLTIRRLETVMGCRIDI